MDIKVLGNGCYDCLQLDLLVSQALQELGLSGPASRVEDRKEMDRHLLGGPPGQVVNRHLVVEQTPANPRGTASMHRGGFEQGRTCVDDMTKTTRQGVIMLIRKRG